MCVCVWVCVFCVCSVRFTYRLGMVKPRASKAGVTLARQ